MFGVSLDAFDVALLAFVIFGVLGVGPLVFAVLKRFQGRPGRKFRLLKDTAAAFRGLWYVNLARSLFRKD